jgi:hypothetical protein
MILNDDLLVLPAMDRVYGTTPHAIRVLALTTGSRDQEIAKPPAIAQQPGEGLTVGLRPVLLNAGLRALITSRAPVQVEHQQALALVEPLFNELPRV